MTRWSLALLIGASLLIASCAPTVRFSYPSGVQNTPPSRDSVSASDHDTPEAEELRDLPSRIDVDQMNRVIANYMSTPYQKGGSGSLGLDCSGFVYVVYRDYDGTRLPLTVESLFRISDRVNTPELSYGDLVFFRADGRKVSHVGIYIGNGKFVHASETRGVTLDDLKSEYFSSIFAGARRVK